MNLDGDVYFVGSMRAGLQPLREPAGAPPRLGTKALPPYQHVPGLTPHPVTHAEGHSFGAQAEQADIADLELPRDWAQCPEYLEGVDLFNRAYFWEAHEEWEALWHAVGHDSLVGRYLQGLIQASAALLKQHSGIERGAASLHAKSTGNLTSARQWSAAREGERFMGVPLLAWEGRLADYLFGRRSPFPFLDPLAADSSVAVSSDD